MIQFKHCIIFTIVLSCLFHLCKIAGAIAFLDGFEPLPILFIASPMVLLCYYTMLFVMIKKNIYWKTVQITSLVGRMGIFGAFFVTSVLLSRKIVNHESPFYKFCFAVIMLDLIFFFIEFMVSNLYVRGYAIKQLEDESTVS